MHRRRPCHAQEKRSPLELLLFDSVQWLRFAAAIFGRPGVRDPRALRKGVKRLYARNFYRRRYHFFAFVCFIAERTVNVVSPAVDGPAA